MDLFHTYVNKTAITLSEDPAVGEIMATAAVDIALKNEFVLHIMLCLAALHRCATGSFGDTGEALSLLEAASDHQNLSMALFRQSITTVTSENAEAVFLFTIMTSWSLYSSHNERLRLQHELEAGEKGQLAHSGWMRTLRGSTAVFGHGIDLRDWLGADSPLLMLIPYRCAFSPAVPEDNEWAQSAMHTFTKLAAHFTEEQPTLHEATIYLVACLAQMCVAQMTLDSGRTIISGEGDENSRISARPSSYCLSWIFHVSVGFLDLLDDVEPGALVVLAHFGVLIHSLRQEWCLGGLGKAVTEACDEALQASGNDSWLEWMNWPRETIRDLDEHRLRMHD